MHKSECTFDFIWGAKMSFRLIYSHFTPVNEIQEMGLSVSDHSIPKPKDRVAICHLPSPLTESLIINIFCYCDTFV